MKHTAVLRGYTDAPFVGEDYAEKWQVRCPGHQDGMVVLVARIIEHDAAEGFSAFSCRGPRNCPLCGRRVTVPEGEMGRAWAEMQRLDDLRGEQDSGGPKA